jgi:hypothetical protein
MLNWLSTHAYVAAWLSPVLALIAMIVQSARPTGRPVNWSKVMIYIAFLTCLAAIFTPTLEAEARMFAGAVVGFSGVYLGFVAIADDEKHQG